jgi:hypothetical protein
MMAWRQALVDVQEFIAVEQNEGGLVPRGTFGVLARSAGGGAGGVAELFFNNGGEERLEGLLLGSGGWAGEGEAPSEVDAGRIVSGGFAEDAVR